MYEPQVLEIFCLYDKKKRGFMTYYQLQEYIKLVDSIMDSKGMNTARQKLHDKINYIKKKMKPKKEQI